MSPPVLIGFAGVLVAAVATGMLAGRCVRQPRICFVVWTAATLGLTIALAAQSMGFASGFGPTTFRAVHMFALLLAPLWLAWGLVELVAANEAARFGMRLVSGALTVVASVILATDPLTAQPFSKSWPLTGPHFQPIAHYALDAGQAVAVVAVVVSAGMAPARARNDPRWRPAMAAVISVGLAVLMTAGLRFSLPARTAYPLLTMLAAALVWFGVTRIPDLPQPAARARRVPRAGQDDRGGRVPRAGQDGQGRYRSGDTPEDDYWPDDAYRPQDDYVPDDQYATYGQRDPRGPARQVPERQDWHRGSGPGGPFADERPGATAAPAGQAPGPEAAALAGSALAGSAALAGSDAEFGAQATAAGSSAATPARPYGRILIFTLLEDRVADFDRLAEQTAEEIRTGEPDTLVYVIHLVPNAPMQRIFYEIYRDRAAFDSHESQPYMQRFVAERRSCVLATNVIELRLKYAKVAPLPNPQSPAPAAAPPQSSARAPLPAGPPQRLPPLRSGPPAGARGPLGAPGTQRLQPLPPARPQRSDQQRPDQQRPDRWWPEQRHLPSAGGRYGGT